MNSKLYFNKITQRDLGKLHKAVINGYELRALAPRILAPLALTEQTNWTDSDEHQRNETRNKVPGLPTIDCIVDKNYIAISTVI